MKDLNKTQVVISWVTIALLLALVVIGGIILFVKKPCDDNTNECDSVKSDRKAGIALVTIGSTFLSIFVGFGVWVICRILLESIPGCEQTSPGPMQMVIGFLTSGVGALLMVGGAVVLGILKTCSNKEPNCLETTAHRSGAIASVSIGSTILLPIIICALILMAHVVSDDEISCPKPTSGDVVAVTDLFR